MIPFSNKRENISAELFKDVMNRYVNLDFDKLVKYTRFSFRGIYHFLTNESEYADKTESILKSIILSAVYADGNITPEEKRIVDEIYTIKDFRSQDSMAFPFSGQYIYSRDADASEKTLDFYKSAPPKIKVEILRLIICIASSDGKIPKEETAFIRDLLQRSRTF